MVRLVVLWERGVSVVLAKEHRRDPTASPYFRFGLREVCQLKKAIFLLALTVLIVSAAMPIMADDAARFKTAIDQIVANLNSGNYEAIYGMFNEVMAGKTTKEKAVGTFTLWWRNSAR